MMNTPQGRHRGGDRDQRCSPVLLIDDDEVFRATLARDLQQLGVAVAVADDTGSVLPLLRSGYRPRCVVLEPNLPGASWYHLLQLVAESWPDGRIFVVTAFWSRALAEEAAARGAVACLAKPVSSASLRRLLTEELAEPPPDQAPWPERPVSLDLFEWEHVNNTIRQCAGNMSEAARQLGIHRPTLYKKLRKHPRRPSL